jgi:uncharacterized membrane protein YsdA (DUF1294 family)
MREVHGRPYLFYGLLSGGITWFTAYLSWAYGFTSLAVSYGVAINVAAFVCMGLDKSLARSKSLRIPETILYLLALLGGSLGILFGIHIFQHKTRKAAFQFVLLMVVAIQFAFIRIAGIEVR